jgi:hypothetical protein
MGRDLTDQSQNANVLVSMLSRAGAFAGVSGSSNALCAVKREGTFMAAVSGLSLSHRNCAATFLMLKK